MINYDVLIIGAGPAGLTCAIELAKKNISCLLLEKKENLAGTVCGDGVSAYSIELIKKIGISIDSLRGKTVYYKKEYRGNNSKTFSFYELFGSNYELGVSRDILDNIMLKYATEQNIPIVFNKPCKEIKKNDDGLYIINEEYGSRYLVYACGVTGGTNLGFHYSKDLPVGISGRISGVCTTLEDDTFHYFFSEKYGDGYGWIFPVGNNLWNIGVWSHNKKKELKELYYELEKKFFNEESFIYDRKPQGRVIGAGKFVMPDDSRAFCIGDCALSANSLSGEGISYALESGINVSNLIASQITKGMNTLN